MTEKKCFNEKGNCIGIIKGDVFDKVISFKKHLFRKADAVAIDQAVFDKEIFPCCKSILVTDSDSGQRLKVTVEEFKKTAFLLNLGHSAQLFLPRKYWDKA